MTSTEKKGAALVSGLALVFGSLIAATPANAAFGPEDIKFVPDGSGEDLSVFTLDKMEMGLELSPFVPSGADGTERTQLAFSSSDSPVLMVQFDEVASADADRTIDVTGISANGNPVDLGIDNQTINADDSSDTGEDLVNDADQPGAFIVDFDHHEIETLVVHGIDTGLLSRSVGLSVQVMNNNSGDDSQSSATNGEIADLGVSSYGEGSFTIQAQAWLETGDGSDTQDLTVDAAASDVTTLQFWDPQDTSATVKIDPRKDDNSSNFFLFNENTVPVEVDFNRDVNLEMIDLTHWNFDIVSTGASDSDTGETPTRRDMLGFDNQDDFGKLTVSLPYDNSNLAVGDVVSVEVTSSDAGGTKIDSARTFRSPSREVLVEPNDEIDDLEYSVSPADQVGDNDSGGVSVRAETESVTYTATAVDSSGDALGANYPVIAEVTFTNAAAPDDVISVSGSLRELPQDGVVLVSGVTNSDGEFPVTVTMSNPADAAQYTIDFSFIDDTGAADAMNSGTITATVGDTTYSQVDTDSSAYNGSSVTIEATVIDQFEEAHSVEDGEDIKVRVEATDTDDLELFQDVVDGEATFTFDTFLEVGESDVLTVTAYTGADTNPTDLGSTLVTLYNSDETDSVTITDDDLTATVVYDDFVASGDEGNVDAADAVTLSGNVLDSLGQGVPGAAVTVTGEGLQFQNLAGDFSIGTAALTADEFGAWTVEVWTHTAGDVPVTISSAGESVDGNVEGELPDQSGSGLSAANLNIDWNLPDAVVTNTTYAVTATVTDTWGNPVPGATIEFAAAGSATINSDATVDRTTRSNGQATAYLRSLEDVTGVAGVSAEITEVNYDGQDGADVTDLGSAFTDDEDTVRDESVATNLIEEEINFLTSAPAASGDQKVNAGSFKGYVALYAKGYEGQRMSAIVAGKWLQVDSLDSDYERIVRFTGAGYDIKVRIYIDGEQVGPEFDILTK